MKSKGNWILNRKGLIIICRILKNIWKKLYFILFRYLVAEIMHKTDMKSCNGIVQVHVFGDYQINLSVTIVNIALIL